MDITTDKRKLVDIIKNAKEGRIVLPQFQRTFVWEYNDVVDFLLSLMKGYFIGSFLFQRCDSDSMPFDYRVVEGVDLRKEELRPDYIVLDGQQRLTTLHYVLYSPPNVTLKNTRYPYQFFLDLNKVISDEIDDSIFGVRKDRCENLLKEEYGFENGIIPFTILKGFQSWDTWLDKYQDWLRERNPEKYNKFLEKTRSEWKAAINKFFDTNVPIIEIQKIRNNDEKGISEVCAIFEKMNSTGVPLSVFDLLTARLYKHNIDLHKLWQQTLEGYDLLKNFSEGESNPYGIFILRFIALNRGLDVKSKSLINLHARNFEDD